VSAASYYLPGFGLPAQTELISDRAVVTEAYTVIPRGVLRDIVTSTLPGWTATRTWILNRPVPGGATTFAQYLVEVAHNGGSGHPEPEAGVESFVFLLEGSLTVVIDGDCHDLLPGGFAYVPAGSKWTVSNRNSEPASFQWIRKLYEPIAGFAARVVIGNEQQLVPSSMPGTDGAWATTRMLPVDDLAFDMHVNIVTFEPGASIPFAETHVMEHGLYVLEGKAVYRLNQDWVEVQEGDYLSLRAFCPQACYAGGPARFRYLLYKDVNRQIRLGS
jgi:(S)-ureidoglycine aminohydrolase